MTLLRLYAPYYMNPHTKGEESLKGTPIYSGHVREGEQVFYPYHWIVRTNGSTERLLYDNEIGWHAGDWDVNRRSVAIALDNNYEDSEPSARELQSIAAIITEHYEAVSAENIVGHREINHKTTCPSNVFLGDDGWKGRLLRLL